MIRLLFPHQFSLGLILVTFEKLVILIKYRSASFLTICNMKLQNPNIQVYLDRNNHGFSLKIRHLKSRHYTRIYEKDNSL